MRRSLVLFALLLAACGGETKEEPSIHRLSRQPVSVRGWVLDVEGAQRADTVEVEIARRTQLFQSSSIWVENSPYSSGGIAENGSFIVLDVPPLDATIGINAPGAESARIVIKDVPGNADVFIPNVILKNGSATVADPKAILVRMPSRVKTPTRTGKTATIAGYTVPIIDTPLAQFTDRREYPNPGGFRPVATVK
jgi:hypothetical protein